MSTQTTSSVAPTTAALTLRDSIRTGVIFGGVALFITLVGLVGAFNERDIIYQIITMGQSLLLITVFLGGFMIGRRLEEKSFSQAAQHGFVLGLISGAIMGLYIILGSTIDLREIFVNSSRELLEIITFGLPPVIGAIVLAIAFGITSALGSMLSQAEPRIRRPISTALITLITIGILEDFLNVLLSSGFLRFLAQIFFARSGMSIIGAILLVLISGGYVVFQPAIKERLAPAREWVNNPDRTTIKYGGLTVIIATVLLSLPWVLQLYLSDVIDNVGLFILMGLGLNIVIGFAGLLDLGYVAFYAIGAYTMAVLTSPESILGWEWSFWAALPASMLTAAFAGILLGIPVLRMRGDYLAIVTLGFGEIIRILALSEALKPYIGGSTGILAIPKPVFLGVTLRDAQFLYYVILAACLIALYVSWRLSDSRIGRAWIAMREDEDVAEASGINLVQYKLMAFAIGAMFSGMAGGIFASKLGSIFPHSFNLLISINVLSLIIVGGMASLPGVFVGALILVGLPELLREFSEFRLLMYGAALVAMMLVRPEGFWPAAQRQRELHEDEEPPLPDTATSAAR